MVSETEGLVVQEAYIIDEEFKIYTSNDLCKVFGVSKNTMNKWLRSGILPVVKIGRVYRTSNKLINEWMKRNAGKQIKV